MMNNKPKKSLPSTYVWFDTEFNTLDLERAVLLQVAVMITDTKLNRLTAPEEDINCYVQVSDDLEFSPWVKQNIPGVISGSRSPEALPVAQIDTCLSQFLDKWLGEASEEVSERPLMAGNCLFADWYLARKYLPEFSRRLHYRALDVSALKVDWQSRTGSQEIFDKDNEALVRRYAPTANLDGLGKHDAYYDITASVAELRFYREQAGRDH